MKDYQPAADLLKNRVILITGIGEGIGRAAARRLAGYGATVILLGRTIRKLEQVYDDIEQAGGPKPAIYPMNLEGRRPRITSIWLGCWTPNSVGWTGCCTMPPCSLD
jgi:NAD(P)-dependent dehydrogenase (short-subunit alcohol dehydrogenase family)